MMKCERCSELILPGEEIAYYGRTLCEECYMQVLSPSRACDPWAVRNAQALSEMADDYSSLSKLQVNILEFLKKTGGVEPDILAQQFHLRLPELEREIATLRHMEKLRGQMRAGRKIICLWESGDLSRLPEDKA